MRVTSKINTSKLKAIDKSMQDALIKSVNALKDDLKQSQTMPFDTGAMQNRSMSIDSSKAAQGRVRLVTDTPYARRLYFHPEYNFRQDKNPNAQGKWLETYISGEKKDYLSKAFKRLVKKGGQL